MICLLPHKGVFESWPCSSARKSQGFASAVIAGEPGLNHHRLGLAVEPGLL
eukprot:CAMPEP_0175164808 /NCGR_PEP_ID=MMETSP0087-20121206/26653_1 /TAXON_ID=136419 /ORGANISM="Unknown Unknown, Strain D1" /LENGTH=50 /DNA_ID=CAMNT_0016453949 /DNA_START=153 /DNA_END=305 /DNA_ORIENTATION=-